MCSIYNLSDYLHVLFIYSSFQTSKIDIVASFLCVENLWFREMKKRMCLVGVCCTDQGLVSRMAPPLEHLKTCKNVFCWHIDSELPLSFSDWGIQMLNILQCLFQTPRTKNFSSHFSIGTPHWETLFFPLISMKTFFVLLLCSRICNAFCFSFLSYVLKLLES